MKVQYSEEKIMIDTYPEAEREELPMFAENRVHQRTSGNPYPNKVVLEAQRRVREPREYTLLRLRNEYLEIGILPAIGGKIWYAKDLKNGYSFFYQNHVVKPALIGVLGSWISGGLEFNWPFHHRPSTFMPVDYTVEKTKSAVTVWLSEHDPMDRMKGMVGICLEEGECRFETRVKLDNITPLRRSFLWWENAAVPVNQHYRIFFPEDVGYAHFHYKRSVTSYPIADTDRFGAYNGILFEKGTDLSRHENTLPATSYFSAESEYDFFGGYDESRQAGVVHVADHHISPGKKLFTWGYRQLSKVWEAALTDSDGQYAELMAGCYSDNQPDFAWIEPYETKTFSQYWYPIHGKGVPVFANENGAVYLEEGEFSLQSVRAVGAARAVLRRGGERIAEKMLSLPAYVRTVLFEDVRCGDELELFGERGVSLLHYVSKGAAKRAVPPPRAELPDFKRVETAQELYLEGLHMEQYRSPEYSAEACYREALARDKTHAPSLEALSELMLKRFSYEQALGYAEDALKSLTRFNARTESGRAYYLKGLALLGLERFKEAYNSLYRAAWCWDSAGSAFFHLGLLDLRRQNYALAEEHFRRALNANGMSVTAEPFLGYACWLMGKENAKAWLESALKKDRLNLFALMFCSIVAGDFRSLRENLKTDKTQVFLDLSAYLLEAGLVCETIALAESMEEKEPLGLSAQYLLSALDGRPTKRTALGIAYPQRGIELWALRKACERDTEDGTAHGLLGCLLYGKGNREDGAAEFERAAQLKNDCISLRNCAVARYRAGKFSEAMRAMRLAAEGSSRKQITFECTYLMFKAEEDPSEIARFIEERGYDRDDLTVELARAYNRMGEAQKALDLLLSRRFVAAEGGEDYISDQYTYACYLQGMERYRRGDYEGAEERFSAAQRLPASLGAGFWNEIKCVPYRYFQANCLIRLGKKEKAEEILRGFLRYRFDYFSDLYLPTLAYYVARAAILLGREAEGRELMRRQKARMESALQTEDSGFFKTTPFFLSFIDDSRRARELYCSYPLWLYSLCLGDKEDAARYFERWNRDKYGLYLEDFTLSDT